MQYRMIMLASGMLVAGVGMSMSAPLLAADLVGIDNRLMQLESRFNNREGLALIQRIDALQDAMQNMQGQLEVTQHQLELLEAHQRELYQDIDRRLTQLDDDNDASQTAAVGTMTIDGFQFETIDLDADQSQPNNTSLADTMPAQNQTSSESEQSLYEGAYQLLMDRRYAESIDIFNQYLTRYPEGNYAPNAWYWLGEVYLLQGQYNEAENAFETVMDAFPTHPKAADALLKIGYTYEALGETDRALTTLMQVRSQYQGSAVAELADARMLQIQQTSSTSAN